MANEVLWGRCIPCLGVIVTLVSARAGWTLLVDLTLGCTGFLVERTGTGWENLGDSL